MPSIFTLEHRDIGGGDYAILLRAALSHFNSFSLDWRADLPYVATRHAIGNGLRHHQVAKNQGRIFYRLDADALPILLKTGSLFRWRFPDFPEDLSFYHGTQRGFVSVTHEQMAWITDSEFVRSLPANLGFVEEIVSKAVYEKYWVRD